MELEAAGGGAEEDEAVVDPELVGYTEALSARPLLISSLGICTTHLGAGPDPERVVSRKSRDGRAPAVGLVDGRVLRLAGLWRRLIDPGDQRRALFDVALRLVAAGIESTLQVAVVAGRPAVYKRS